MENQWLVVGLGNPGENYVHTRHNIGFMAIDFWYKHLLERGQVTNASFKTLVRHKKKLALKQSFIWEKQQIILAKPLTYMNLSGTAVKAFVEELSLPLPQLLVLQDDVDQPFGQIRFHYQRGHGGHNGIRNIHHCLQSGDYNRLKLGVGRPQPSQGKGAQVGIQGIQVINQNQGQSVSDFVLSPFSKEEQKKLKFFLELALEAIQCFVLKGQEVAGNTFNRRSCLS